MLKILIVEDDLMVARTLKHYVELNPRYMVTAITNDLSSTLAALEDVVPDLALVDLQLANNTSGFSVAAKLNDAGIACLFTTGNAPNFPLPDLAIGCLGKPFNEADLTRALIEAEDMVRGRQKLVLRNKLPEKLEIYAASRMRVASPASEPPVGSRSSAVSLLQRACSFRSGAQ